MQGNIIPGIFRQFQWFIRVIVWELVPRCPTPLCFRNMYTAAFRTLGCKLNQAETAMLVQDFEAHGYRVISWDEGADVSVLNTCTVTGRTDSKCRQAIRHILKIRSDTTVLVVGCYSQIAAEEIAQIPGVDYIFGNQEKFHVFDSFHGPGKKPLPNIFVTPINNRNVVIPHPVGDYLNHTRAFLKIQSGCDRRCSYCIVPLVRGPSRSVSEEQVVAQAKTLVQRGYKEIVLTGVHVGYYGKEIDGTSHLPRIIQALTKIKNLGRLRLSSLDPEDVTDDLLDCMKQNEKVCRHFHIPLQSGSNQILRAMNRSYSTEIFAEIIDKVKSRFQTFGLGTDIIAGFPGETETLFNETCRFVQTIPFTYFHVFPFSLRKGTEAASLPDPVPSNMIHKRVKELRLLGQIKKNSFSHQWLNKDVCVLLEGRNTNGWMGGFTSEYLRVEIPFEEKWANQFTEVRIDHADGSAVKGTAVNRV